MDFELIKKNTPSGVPSIDELNVQNEGTFKEIFTLNSYGFHATDVADKAVLDIGANIGYFTYLAAASGARMVLSVEPNEENYLTLKRNVGGFKNVIHMQMAAHNGTKDLCETVESGTLAKVVFNEKSSIETRSLFQLTELLPKGNNLVLKMDCEGSEYDIMLAASMETIRRYEIIFMEIHGSGDSFKSLKFLKDYMAYMGYEQVFIFPVFWYTYDAAGKVIDCKKIDIEVLKFKRIER